MLCAEGGKKTEVGSVNCLHWDCKLSQEDAWKQLIIVCVYSLSLCVQYNSGTERQVENDRREKGGGLGGKRASCGYVDRKFGANITGKSKSVCVCLPCLPVHVYDVIG